MKKLISVLALIFTATIVAKAQNTLDTLNALPEIDGKVAYESIVNVPGKTKDVIFNAANNWMLDTYNGNNVTILNADTAQGQILGKGSFKIDYTKGFFAPENDYIYGFKIQIDCKDNKYRVQLYNTVYYSAYSPNDSSSLETYNDILSIKKGKAAHQDAYKVNVRFKDIMQSLAAAVNRTVHDDF